MATHQEHVCLPVPCVHNQHAHGTGYHTVSEYIAKMRGFADEMVSAGKRLDDEDLISYILTGLDAEFNPVLSAVAACVESISVSELFS